MLAWRTGALVLAVLISAGPGAGQTLSGQIEMVKPERCAADPPDSAEPVRCFAWATSTKTGNIDKAEARCSNPEFVPFAKKCLNNHRVKKEFRGSEQKVCVEFTYLFGNPNNYFGTKMLSSTTRTRVLPDCEMPVAPS
jgi:hypothetical protein